MNRNETLKILSVLRAAYPRFYAGMGKQELESIVSLWQEMFDEPYPIVAAATKALIASDSKGFPPVIGQVKEKIRVLSHKEEMTEIEAWGYVSNAIRNSAYGSAEEFEKLPPVVKKLVGSANQLKEWATMDSEAVQSVVASNFMRNYKTRAKQIAEYEALPGDVKRLSDDLAKQLEMPEVPQLCSEQKKRDAIDAVYRYGERIPDADELEAVRRMMNS